MAKLGFYDDQELAEYLKIRLERCKESVEFICGDDASFLPFIYIMWERDFWRDKYYEYIEKEER